MINTNSIVDVSGIRVGHAQDETALTGCTVVLCEAGATAGVDQRGGAPGTRETDALHPMRLVSQIHAVVLSGGSAFGLDAASGVAAFLEERGVGFDVGVAHVPIVPAAVLFDLGIGSPTVRPNAAMGYQACLNASKQPPSEGNFGAGCGATVGKILGMSRAMKSGIGSASVHLNGGLVVGALAAVNPFGDVIDPGTSSILAGARRTSEVTIDLNQADFADTLQVMKNLAQDKKTGFSRPENTVIGVVATNARLDKEGANFVAMMAQDGLARAIRPAHTLVDGDTIFALSTGGKKADINLIGALAAEVFAEAIVRAVKAARPAGGIPGLCMK